MQVYRIRKENTGRYADNNNVTYNEGRFSMTSRICSECRNCSWDEDGTGPEEATIKVRFPNERSYSPAPPITEWVCNEHYDMLVADYGDDLKVIAKKDTI